MRASTRQPGHRHWRRPAQAAPVRTTLRPASPRSTTNPAPTLDAARTARISLVVHDAARTGYNQQADVYASVRPSYHPALVERFIDRYATGVVADVGAGTGIFTSQLVEAGCVPIAIEPVASMRHAITVEHPTVTVVDGTAEDTGLDDSSVDTVVAAQAFHWFDHDAALAEIERILRPEGFVVCVWNVRDETVDWVRRYTDVVDQHAGDTPRHRTMKWRHAIDDSAAFEPVDDWSIANPRLTTPQQVVDRALSTSFIAALEPAVQTRVLNEIRRIAHDVGASFDFPYRSEIQAWRLVSSR